MLNVYFLKNIILINKKNFNLKKTKNKNQKIDETNKFRIIYLFI